MPHVNLRPLRANPRFTVALKGFVADSSGRKRCLVHDISQTGFLLICTSDYLQGQVLHLYLEKLWHGEDFDCEVEVCHLSNYGLGARIVECSERSAKTLKGWVDNLRRNVDSPLTSAASEPKRAAILPE